MKIRNVAVPVLVLSLLAGCSLMDKKPIDYKSDVSQVSPLEIPPDLTTIATTDQYAIPGGDKPIVANYSDYSKSVAVQTVKAEDNTEVLPVSSKMHIEREGIQHWIVVQDTAENIWPGIKAFWLQLGFRVPVESARAGVMETDWLENRGNVPRSYVRQVAGNGKAVDSLKSEGIRDQYVTRVERSKDGLSTEIHIIRQVMQEAQTGNRKEFKWLPHESNPELEIAVLQLMMAKLASNSGLPKAAKPDLNAASAVPLLPAPEAVSVQFKETAAGKVIQINEPFDRSWRRVGLAIDAARIVTSDKDRSKGVYFVAAVQDKNNKKPQSDYQVTVRENKDGSEVAVVNPNGKNDAESARFIEILFQNMGGSPSPEVKSPKGNQPVSQSADAVRPAR